MIKFQIIQKLLLPPLMILIAMPDFQLDNKLLSKVVYDDICTPLISCLCLQVIVPCAIDNRL